MTTETLSGSSAAECRHYLGPIPVGSRMVVLSPGRLLHPRCLTAMTANASVRRGRGWPRRRYGRSV